MVLFKKRDDSGIPEIPRLPEFSPVSKERGLPSLPGSSSEDMNRSIIKSAMEDESNDAGAQDLQEGLIPFPPMEKLPQESEMILSREPSREDKKSLVEGPESVFVRIDKFKSAKKELASIKKGLLEAEAVINKINEIKKKEDNEINDINLNLNNIKSKVEEIDSLVFDKV